MAKKKAVTFEIINTQTGEKKTVRDNLYNNLFSNIQSNGKQVWRKKSDVANESTSFVNQETTPNQSVLINELQTENKALKDTITKLQDELSVCKNVNFPEKTDQKEVVINPFDIVELGLLQTWFADNSIPFAKTITKLETLQTKIPEIYKK